MAQIPIFGGSQQISASNPVSIGSGESARMQGEAVAGFGEAMFKVGNALDTVARRAKDASDKLVVSRATDLGRLAMLREKAAIDAEGLQPGDSADGFSSVDRYNERINPILDNIGSNLPQELRGQFYADIADDVVTESTKVLAGSVAKREKTVPILLQDSLMAKAMLAKSDPKLTEQVMAEGEILILENALIAEKDKPGQILNYKKSVAGSILEGYMEKGNQGDQSAWNTARAELSGKYGQIYTKEEYTAMSNAIDTTEYAWNTRTNAAFDRQVRYEDKARKENMEKASSSYQQMLKIAGNSDVKRNPIVKLIAMDPKFDQFPQQRAALIGNRVFMEEADDRYEIKMMYDALKSKNFGKLRDQVRDDQGINVSLDRGTKLMKNLNDMADFARKDPTLMSAVNQWKDEIESYSKAPTMDWSGKLNAQERDTANEKAQTDFMMGINRLSEQGNLNARTVESLGQSVLKTLGGRTVQRNIPGISADRMSTVEGVDSVLKDIAKKIQSGKATPEEKRRLPKLIQDLKTNRKAAETKKAFDLNYQPAGNSGKIFDE